MRDYEPFGEEWEKEVMGMTKKHLVANYKRVCQELRRKERIEAEYFSGFTIAEQPLKSVWIVRYGNYFPMEVDSIWDTEDAAEEYLARESPSEWVIEKVLVQSSQLKPKGEKNDE